MKFAVNPFTGSTFVKSQALRPSLLEPLVSVRTLLLMGFVAILLLLTLHPVLLPVTFSDVPPKPETPIEDGVSISVPAATTVRPVYEVLPARVSVPVPEVIRSMPPLTGME